MSVRVVPSSFGYDLLVNDHVRVAIRVAFPSYRRHRVSVGDRRYSYRYKTWHFNFHHHGRFDARYADFFVCLAVSDDRRSIRDSFIIPWESVTGKTFSLHGGQRRYEGRYAGFRGRWDSILAAARGQALRRVA